MLFTSLLACTIPGLGAASQSTDDLARIRNEVLIKRVVSTVRSQCIRCHSGDAGAVFSLRSGANLVRYARGIVGEVLGQRMPPGIAQSSFGHFLPNQPLTPADVAYLWEWANRSEKGKVSAADMSLPIGSSPPSPPTPSLQLPIPISVPAEGDDGLSVFKFQTRVPTKFQNRPVTVFWITSSLPGQIARVRLDLGSVRMGWSFGNRPWSIRADGPALPAQISGEIVALSDGERHSGKAILNFTLGAAQSAQSPKKVSAATRWRSIRQPIDTSGRTELTLPRSATVFGFHPNFSTQLESWEATVAAVGAPRRRFAAQPAAVSRSIGTYYLADPLKLAAGSRLGFVVQFRRNHRSPVSADWLVRE